MSSLALPSNAALLPLLARAEKREAVEALILGRARKHVAMDVTIGVAGFLPLPGAGLASNNSGNRGTRTRNLPAFSA